MVDKRTLREETQTQKCYQTVNETSQPKQSRICSYRKREYQCLIRKAKWDSWKHFCTANFNDDPFGALKMLKSRLNPTPRITELEDCSGNTTTEVREILHVLGDHFFPENFGPETEEQHRLTVAAHRVTPSQNQILSGNENPEITEREIKQAVFSTPCNKAPGLDGIQGFIYQLYYNILKKHLLQLFNSCLRLQHFPSSWKIAHVIFIKKPNKENTKLPSSYRPISLLPVIGKIFEKVLNSRLRWIATE